MSLKKVSLVAIVFFVVSHNSIQAMRQETKNIINIKNEIFSFVNYLYKKGIDFGLYQNNKKQGPLAVSPNELVAQDFFRSLVTSLDKANAPENIANSYIANSYIENYQKYYPEEKNRIIPKKIHYIWAGHKDLYETFKENILKTKKASQDCRVIVWHFPCKPIEQKIYEDLDIETINTEKLSDELRDWCKKNAIEYKNIPETKEYKKYVNLHKSMQDRLNYGFYTTFKNIFQAIILYEQGGLSLDCDMILKDEGYNVIFKTEYQVGTVFVLSPQILFANRNNPFYWAMLKGMHFMQEELYKEHLNPVRERSNHFRKLGYQLSVRSFGDMQKNVSFSLNFTYYDEHLSLERNLEGDDNIFIISPFGIYEKLDRKNIFDCVEKEPWHKTERDDTHSDLPRCVGMSLSEKNIQELKNFYSFLANEK